MHSADPVFLLRQMLRARALEETAAEEYAAGRIAGFLHLYPGEEAVAAGVLSCAEPGDYIVSTYREHVHALLRGIPAAAILAELLGKKTGVSGGMGGSMHLFDAQRRFLGGYAIVGETFPIALGAGYAVAYRQLPEAVICFFGDGAVNQGTFHESLNMAALWRLPILFVCENNHYQIGTEIHRHSAVVEVYRRACAYNIPAERINGMDVLAVQQAAEQALALIRAGQGPQFLEFETYRYRGHSMADPGAYRPASEVQAYQSQDPIKELEGELFTQANCPAGDCVRQFQEQCCAAGHLSSEGLRQLQEEIAAEMRTALADAQAAPMPSLTEAQAIFQKNHRFENFFGRGVA
ncbi:thiamine pyrophosphate-dependent enzyme [Acidithiobacillus sp. AMEEHan]|uniref:thiamine pyrophosphate-dependent enzyme n=1 Tax=Acidithiobacillus sp. AMEEHan TaxID=2994951 RepID=UPI0027E4C1B4|nr:thiamine pyrophosphate-dependent enzyme [Acidithiobacillus sp. AMEEHan]